MPPFATPYARRITASLVVAPLSRKIHRRHHDSHVVHVSWKSTQNAVCFYLKLTSPLLREIWKGEKKGGRECLGDRSEVS